MFYSGVYSIRLCKLLDCSIAFNCLGNNLIMSCFFIQVYHPNIDLEGNVCLNILREDWKPVLTINAIVYGLQYLFLEPNPEDPLNREAANELQVNRRLFEQNVQRTMRGGTLNGVYFEQCLK